MAKYVFYDADVVTLLVDIDKGKPSGGAAVQSYVWINGLKALGHKIYIPLYDDVENSIPSDIDGVGLIPFYDRNRGLRWLRWIYYRFPNIYRSLKKINPDYLYESIPSWGSFFLGVICKRLNIKYIIRLSNDNLLDDRFFNYQSKTHQFLLKRGIRMSDYLLCQNEYQYNLASKMFPHNNILKISNPFVFKEKEGKHFHRRYIAWIANFRFQKNLKLLYEIALLLEEEQFEVAGTYIRTDPETDEYLKRLRSLKNVNFRGYINRDDILDFLAEGKFLLNTSRYEGFSNTFLEAMSVGTPILTTLNANPDQVINNNEIGIIYYDSNELKTKLDQLSKEDYRQMSHRCIEYVKENHDHMRLTKKLTQFLEGVK